MNEANSTIIRQWGSKSKGASPENLNQADSAVSSTGQSSIVRDWRSTKQAASNKTKSDSKGALANSVASGFRFGTYKLYCMSWRFIYYVFPILYLWIHFLIRYVGSFKSFSDFANPFAPATLQTEIQRDDKNNTDIGWMIVFILLSFVVLALLALLAILIYIMVKYISLDFWERVKLAPGTVWHLIKGGPEEAFEYALEKLLKE